MIAVVKTGGKQYKVAEGDEIQVEKIEGNIGDRQLITRLKVTAINAK